VETYLALRRFHVWTSGRSTQALTSLSARLWGHRDAVGDQNLDAMVQQWGLEAEQLKTHGACTIANVFTDDEVAQLTEFARYGPARLVRNDGSVGSGTYQDRTDDVVAVQLDQSFVLTQPAVQAMMARGVAAGIATARHGVRPTVHPPILTWSCQSSHRSHDATEQRLAQRFHSDFDGLGGLRLHVYLTDVDGGAAPMDYVMGSHRPGAIPKSVRSDVTDDLARDVVNRLFPDARAHTFTGPAGTSFMSDANGLHRGNRPTTTDRLFLVMALQAGSLGGAYNRVRSIPVVDPALQVALSCGRPDLRLFEAAPPGVTRPATYA
jgi:hypothetical protein